MNFNFLSRQIFLCFEVWTLQIVAKVFKCFFRQTTKKSVLINQDFSWGGRSIPSWRDTTNKNSVKKNNTDSFLCPFLVQKSLESNFSFHSIFLRLSGMFFFPPCILWKKGKTIFILQITILERTIILFFFLQKVLNFSKNLLFVFFVFALEWNLLGTSWWNNILLTVKF